MLCWICSIIFWLGFIRLTVAVVYFVTCALRHFSKTGLNLVARYGEGSYAVVTGATGGIGAEFSKQLAKKGFNLVMIDIDQAALDELAKTIQSENERVQVRTIASNFAEAKDVDFYNDVILQLEDLDVSLFVNNAGMTTYGDFEAEATKSISDIVKVNAVAPALFMNLMVKRLQNRPKRG